MQILTPGAEQLVIWSEACVNFLKDLWQGFFLDMLIRCCKSMQRIHLLTGSTKMQLFTLSRLWHPKLRHRRYLYIVFIVLRYYSADDAAVCLNCFRKGVTVCAVVHVDGMESCPLCNPVTVGVWPAGRWGTVWAGLTGLWDPGRQKQTGSALQPLRAPEEVWEPWNANGALQKIIRS